MEERRSTVLQAESALEISASVPQIPQQNHQPQGPNSSRSPEKPVPHLASAEGLGNMMSQGLCAKKSGSHLAFSFGSPSWRGSQALEAMLWLEYNRPADLGECESPLSHTLGQVPQPL